ncbi:hypothetical protein ACWGR4_35600 [Embleya sp. NPDC055664]
MTAPVMELSDIGPKPCDLVVAPGEYVTFTGPSAKSTFLKVAGLPDRPTQGVHTLNGIDAESLRQRNRTALRGSRNRATGHDRAEPVAVIHEGVAQCPGITTLDTSSAVFIGDAPFRVIGVLAGTDRKADLLLPVLVPRATAEKMYGPPKPGQRATIQDGCSGASCLRLRQETRLHRPGPQMRSRCAFGATFALMRARHHNTRGGSRMVTNPSTSFGLSAGHVAAVRHRDAKRAGSRFRSARGRVTRLP